MQDTVTIRFLKCHDHLIQNKVVRSSRQFALSLEYLPQSMSEVINGRRNVTIELIRKAVELYKFNPCFIFEGTGAPISDGSAQNQLNDVLVVLADSDENERIVHVPTPAQAGYGGQLSDPTYIRQLPSFTLPDPYFKRGTFRSFDISGDSMEPTIFEGEQVVCSYVEKDSWTYGIKNGYVYVIITKHDVVIKRLRNHILTDKTIVLISDNDFYEERILPIQEVVEIWLVKMKISPFMPSPKNVRNALHHEIDDLRNTLKIQNRTIQELNATIEKLLKQNRATR